MVGTADGTTGSADRDPEASGGRAADAAARPAAVPERNRFPTRVVGPVVQFSLLIVPVVLNTFYLVYALLGVVLEGRDHLNWSIEAGPNALGVCAALVAFCAVVAAFALLRGARLEHPLIVSSAVHAVLAAGLTGLILVTARA